MTYKKVPKIKRDEGGSYPMTIMQQANAAPKMEEGLYMIATEANHQMGELHREFGEMSVENLCFVTKETEDHYIGAWITGYGFFNVMYPKKSTRRLTKEEVEYFRTKSVRLANYTPVQLKDVK